MNDQICQDTINKACRPYVTPVEVKSAIILKNLNALLLSRQTVLPFGQAEPTHKM